MEDIAIRFFFPHLSILPSTIQQLTAFDRSALETQFELIAVHQE